MKCLCLHGDTKQHLQNPNLNSLHIINSIRNSSRELASPMHQSSSFKYLGLVFHESGGLSPALKRLAQNAVGARAQLQAKFRRLMCDKSVPMMRRLFDALVMPTVSYGAEIWGTLCSHPLPPDIKQMADVQVSFLRQLCCLRRSVTPAIIFRGVG